MGLTEAEIQGAVAICVASHCSGLIFMYSCVKMRRHFETILGFAAMTFSMIYHVTDLQHSMFLGMDWGSWHRLDNIFASLALVSLFILMMSNNSTAMDESFRWIYLILILGFQQQNAWSLFNSFFPLVVALVFCLLRHLFRRRLPRFIRQRNFLLGMVLLLVGAVFFVRGLDDDNDYLRWQHSMWHFFVFMAFTFLIKVDWEDPIAARWYSEDDRSQTTVDTYDNLADREMQASPQEPKRRHLPV